MKLLILNRVGNKSLFNEAMNLLVSCKGNKLILGYGYIAEEPIKELVKNIKYGFKDVEGDKEVIIIGYQRGQKPCNMNKDFIDYKMDELVNYYKDNLRNITTDKSACKKRSEVNYNNDIHYNNLFSAVEFLVKELSSDGINTTLLIKKENNTSYKKIQYHKKIAIKISDEKISMCIIGSSNLTLPAYEDNKDYNQEVDILLWNAFNKEIDESKILNTFCKENEILKQIIEEKNIELDEDILNPITKIDYKIDNDLDIFMKTILDEIETQGRFYKKTW